MPERLIVDVDQTQTASHKSYEVSIFKKPRLDVMGGFYSGEPWVFVKGQPLFFVPNIPHIFNGVLETVDSSGVANSAYFGNIRTLIPATSGQRFGNIRTAFRQHPDTSFSY